MKFILIYYTSAVWCMNCNDYLATVKRAILAANMDDCCELQVVDVTDNPPETTRMLQKLPTMLITDQMGVEQSRQTGYTSVTKLVDWIQWTTQD